MLINAYFAIQCLCCNKSYSGKIDEELNMRFKNTFKFSNDINIFIFMLRKGVYPYGYMDELEKFMKDHCLKKKNFIAI